MPDTDPHRVHTREESAARCARRVTYGTARRTSPEAIRPVRCEITTDSEGYVSVWPIFAGVDRPKVSGMSCGKDKRLAAAYAAAMMDGQAYEDAFIATDLAGQTYVCEQGKVSGRRLRADLRALGY